ncbi:hypothetical protein CRUP_023073, partial [Coryphaenoides rupestris]
MTADGGTIKSRIRSLLRSPSIKLRRSRQQHKENLGSKSGHMPAVRVWEVSECVQVVALQEHKYGVSCVSFSPNSKYIVSVGYQHDMIINVWNWKLRNNFFSDVACGRGKQAGSTYCITSSGLLCEFNDRRLLDKWVELRTCQATCVCVTEELLFCGCADGTVRAFSPITLHFLFTMPRPHHLGCDISSLRHASQLFASPPDVRYPDTVCVTYDPASRWLSCVYSDHSLYVWDVRDPQRPGKLHSALYHASCVWSLE